MSGCMKCQGDVEIIGSDDAEGGVRGLGMAVLAPAVANALDAGTGKRLRNRRSTR